MYHIFFQVTSAQTLPEILTREGASTLVELIAKAELTETLSGDGPFTVFAPTNDALQSYQGDLNEEFILNHFGSVSTINFLL